ncbi:MAG: hypothetical protein AB7U61_07970 [Methylocystis sp.]
MTRLSVDEELAALRAALYVTAIPSRGAQLRNEPLSAGVGLLLRIVANEDAAIDFYSARIGTPPEALREAAAFYLEQAMFTPHADSYRVLGASRQASGVDLRRNLVLLCRWLHSDRCEELQRSVFFLRVIQAWNNLKTPERRAAYDAALNAMAAPASVSRIPGESGVERSAGAGAKEPAPRGLRLGKRIQKKRMNGPRKSRPRGLWRLIALGWSRRAR